MATQSRIGWRPYVNPFTPEDPGTPNTIDQDVTNFILTSGISDSVQINAIETLVSDLKAYGLWTKMKALYPFVGGSAASHKFNLKDPRDLNAAYRLVFNGGWVHSSNGAQPNGTTGYADSKYNPYINGQLNSAHISYYSRTNSSSSNAIDMGALSATPGNYHHMHIRYTGDLMFGLLNTSSAISVSNNISQGLFISSRINNTNVSLYRNNSNIGNVSLNSSTQPSNNIYIGAGNITNLPQQYSSKESSFISIGDGLTYTEATNFYTSVQKFQTTLGRQVGTPYVSDPDAIAFLNAAGITDGTQAVAINTLVIRMKVDGVWTKMKAIYPFVGGNANSHKFNLKDPRDLDAAFRLVFNGGWTHTGTGALPNGTTGYADTKLVPSSTLSLNSTHILYYSRTNISTMGSDFGTIGSYTYTNNLYGYIKYNDGKTYFRINRGGTLESSIDIPDSRLFYMMNRTSSSQEILFTNTTKNTFNYNSTGLSPFPVFLGASNKFGTGAFEYSSRESAFATIGDGLTDTEALAFYNAVQAYQTTLGRQVNIPLVSDTDAQAFLNAANITSFQQASAVNKLVVDLKAAGVWTKMKAIYPFVGGSATSHKFNLKDPRDLDAAYRLVFNGGGTHGPNGYLGNGSNSYANTYFNPSLNLTTSSAHHSVYLRLDLPISPFKAYGCMTNFSQGSMFLYPYSYNIGWISDLFDYSQSRVSSNSGNSTGYVIGTRASSNSNKLFRNGTQIASSSNSTSGIIPNLNYFIGAYNNNGSPNDYDTNQIAFYSLGDGLTDTETTSLYTAVQTYQTSLGRQVTTPIYNNGLVLNLDAGNANSYPGTGTTWFDLASGNNGTLLNGPTYDVNNGGSILFDGVNDNVDLGTGLNSTSLTISLWLNFNSTSNQGILNKGNFMNNQASYTISYYNNKIRFDTYASDAVYGTLSSNFIPVLNTWYNIVYVSNSNSSTYSIYINGINRTTDLLDWVSTYVVPRTGSYLVKLGSNSDGSLPFRGKISKVLIYENILSATEILNNFNSTRGRFGL